MSSTPPDRGDAPTVLASLERSLAEVDALGAWIAAAHLDATIAQLRLYLTLSQPSASKAMHS